MCTQLWLVLAVMKGQLSPVWFLSSPNRCRAELTAATPTPHMGRMGSTATNWIICLSPIFVKRPICRNQRGFDLPVGVRAQLLPEIQSAGFYIYLFSMKILLGWETYWYPNEATWILINSSVVGRYFRWWGWWWWVFWANIAIWNWNRGTNLIGLCQQFHPSSVSYYLVHS